MPVGNPSPAYAISVREGEDLYTDSVVVLDAMTGAYKRHFKLVPPGLARLGRRQRALP